MAKGTSFTPKRGAFPTPKDILDAAKPYKPQETDKSGSPGDQSKSEPDSQEESCEQPRRDSRKND